MEPRGQLGLLQTATNIPFGSTTPFSNGQDVNVANLGIVANLPKEESLTNTIIGKDDDNNVSGSNYYHQSSVASVSPQSNTSSG